MGSLVPHSPFSVESWNTHLQYAYFCLPPSFLRFKWGNAFKDALELVPSITHGKHGPCGSQSRVGVKEHPTQQSLIKLFRTLFDVLISGTGAPGTTPYIPIFFSCLLSTQTLKLFTAFLNAEKKGGRGEGVIFCSSSSSFPNSFLSVLPLKITGNGLRYKGLCAGLDCLSFIGEKEDWEGIKMVWSCFPPTPPTKPLSVNEQKAKNSWYTCLPTPSSLCLWEGGHAALERVGGHVDGMK